MSINHVASEKGRVNSSSITMDVVSSIASSEESGLDSSAEALRRDNPGFARLVDVISGTYHEDGMLAPTHLHLKQVRSRWGGKLLVA